MSVSLELPKRSTAKAVGFFLPTEDESPAKDASGWLMAGWWCLLALYLWDLIANHPTGLEAACGGGLLFGHYLLWAWRRVIAREDEQHRIYGHVSTAAGDSWENVQEMLWGVVILFFVMVLVGEFFPDPPRETPEPTRRTLLIYRPGS